MEKEIKRTGLEAKFLDVCLPVVLAEELGLYDLEYIAGSKTLKLFVIDEKTKSAVLQDCIKVDRALSEIMESDWVPDDIVLEVSSPGLFRKLRSIDHFEAQVEEFVSVTIQGQLPEQGLSLIHI